MNSSSKHLTIDILDSIFDISRLELGCGANLIIVFSRTLHMISHTLLILDTRVFGFGSSQLSISIFMPATIVNLIIFAVSSVLLKS